MTFVQLQYLLEVSRTGSISGAAKSLYLAQSSVSAAISNLEQELGFPIFVRGKRGVMPTAQGVAVIEQAARICESYHVMASVGANTKRHVRIGAPDIAPLDKAFADLIARYASSDDVTFSVDSFSTPEAVQRVAAFELDVAVLLNHEARLLSVETLLKSKKLAWQVIGTLPVVIRVGPDHPLYEKKDVRIEELQDMLFVDDVQYPLVRNEFLKGVIRLTPERTVFVKSSKTRDLLVERGLCYAIGAGSPNGVTDTSHLRNIPLKDITYTVTIVTNPQRKQGREAEDYVHLVEKALKRA